jgi:Uncharacterized protein conserved in bacteria C-term(DUF2220)
VKGALQACMNPEAALDEPLIRRVFERALDRLDAQPAAERTHPVRINLTVTIAPEIHQAESLAARDVAWAAVDGVVAAGWARLDYRLHRRHGAREEREPYLDITWSEAIEQRVRLKLGRPRKALSYGAQWRALVERENLALSEAALVKLCASPIQVSGRPIEEVLSRFLSIRMLAHQPLLLREVSSQVFWGLSKLLDGRGEAVAALLDAEECPFPEQPIVLNVHLADRPNSLLFVENHVSFERLQQRNNMPETALILSSGFRAAAARLRKIDGCSVYYSRGSNADAMPVFEAMLFSAPDVTVFFWGDLDFGGMAILASLRLAFPSAQAWRPGYEPMLTRLINGDGHSAAESGKERQRPVDQTGCPYADEVLIPALRSYARFVDQE